MLSSKEEGEKLLRRQNRYERYLRVIELRQQGLSERAIARTLTINRATVRKFLRSDGFPERASNKRRDSILNPYIPYVHRRWAEGCDNAHQLWRELQVRGYEGKVAMVHRYIKAPALPASRALPGTAGEVSRYASGLQSPYVATRRMVAAGRTGRSKRGAASIRRAIT